MCFILFSITWPVFFTKLRVPNRPFINKNKLNLPSLWLCLCLMYALFSNIRGCGIKKTTRFPINSIFMHNSSNGSTIAYMTSQATFPIDCFEVMYWIRKVDWTGMNGESSRHEEASLPNTKSFSYRLTGEWWWTILLETTHQSKGAFSLSLFKPGPYIEPTYFLNKNAF